MPDLIGKLIKHYKIIKQVGQGGMGVVYKAQDTKLDRTVALKILPSDITVNETDKERFLQEAKAAAALNHPNVCVIHDIQEYEDPATTDSANKQQFIVMEYVDGETLRDKIKEKRLKKEEIIEIAIQIGEALQEAHNKGIVHRDVKSDNIMITASNQAKVMDFGLAKLKGSLKLTKSSSTVGTLAYMAPEQIQGGEVDARSDIFSFGVVIYEMLTGKCPFKGDYEASVIYSILNDEPEPLQKLVPDVSSELLHIINRVLEKDPENRYQSMKDIIIDLRRLKRDSDKVSRQVKADTESSKVKKDRHLFSVNKKKRLFYAVSILVIFIGLMIALYLWYQKSTETGKDRVAVAFFENETGDASFDFLERQIAEKLNQEIGRLNYLEVAPLIHRDELPQSSSGSKLLEDLSNKTKADIIVSGTFFKSESKLSIQPQITNIRTNTLLRALPAYEGPVDTPQIAIDEMLQRILTVFGFKYDLQWKDGLNLISTVPKFDSFEEFKEGWELLLNFNNDGAVLRFEKALQFDSEFVFCKQIMAVAYGNLGQMEKADSIARSLAKSRDEFSEYERGQLLWIEYWIGGKLIPALQIARKMALLDPEWYYNAAYYAYRINRLDETKMWLSKIRPGLMSMEKWQAYWAVYGYAEHLCGNFEEELQLAIKRRKLYPDSRGALYHEMRANIGLGNINKVEKSVAEMYTLSRGYNPGRFLLDLAEEFKVHGYIEQAVKFTKKSLDWHQTRSQEERNSLNFKTCLFDVLSFSVFHLPQEQKPTDNIEIGARLKTGLTRDENITFLKQLAEELVRDNPQDMSCKGRYGVMMAKLGEKEKALKVFDWLGSLKRPYLRGSNISWQADIAANLGEKKRAVALFQDAFHKGKAFPTNYHTDPDKDPLRDYPPFQEFIKPKK